MITGMKWLLIMLLAAFPGFVHAQSPLPDHAMTPGAMNQIVKQNTISDTICQRGWTNTIRPPVGYTEPLKKRQIQSYGYSDRRPWHYEEDHLVPLDLGGAPFNPRNLWPEPHLGPHQWGAYAKDHLEAKMVRLVCAHRVRLAAARRMMAQDWIAAYRRFIGPDPDNRRPGSWSSRRWRN
jgi:hypothetical protein